MTRKARARAKIEGFQAGWAGPTLAGRAGPRLGSSGLDAPRLGTSLVGGGRFRFGQRGGKGKRKKEGRRKKEEGREGEREEGRREKEEKGKRRKREGERK